MKIPIAKTKLTEKEYDIISQPLKNGWLVQGEFVRDFEDKFSEFAGVKFYRGNILYYCPALITFSIGF